MGTYEKLMGITTAPDGSTDGTKPAAKPVPAAGKTASDTKTQAKPQQAAGAVADVGKPTATPTVTPAAPSKAAGTPADGTRPQENAQQENAPAAPADAVMGFDKQIEALQEAAKRLKPETEQERKERERKERSKKTMAAVSDGLMALGNLYFTTKGAPNMYDHRTMSRQAPLQAQLERLRAEREANADRYLQYYLRMGDLRNERAKTLREMEAEMEERKLAREKDKREQEEHEWEKVLQPDKQREQKGKADKAGSEATTAAEEAKYAPEMQKAKVETEKARGTAAKASATASYARARAADRSNQGGKYPLLGRSYKSETEYNKAVYREARERNIPLYEEYNDGIAGKKRRNKTTAQLAAEVEADEVSAQKYPNTRNLK